MTASLVLALVIAAPARKDPQKADPSGLVGRWPVESATFAGMAIPKPDVTITFAVDGKYETRGPGGAPKVSGTFPFDPKKGPPELDVSEPANAGKVSPSIFKIDGDTLN